jgi:hypothetical protein
LIKADFYEEEWVRMKKYVFGHKVYESLRMMGWIFIKVDCDLYGYYENWSKNGTEIFAYEMNKHFSGNGDFCLITEFGKIVGYNKDN